MKVSETKFYFITLVNPPFLVSILTDLLEENRLGRFECPQNYIPVRGGTAAYFRDKLILWGGQQNNEEDLSKISCLQSNHFSLAGSFEKIYEGSDYSFSRYTDLLFCSEKYADVHFSIEGQRIPAHKLVLCLRCKYFSRLFTSKSYIKLFEKQSLRWHERVTLLSY